ncbi:MAG: PfkB family carbohydrate kinase [Candidatus Omnitrophica bacterium]|nr:PfkB family carbohydrate kinase [Candidatus Omnitrophota bacterium]MDD5611133.1 PfkB family carbohydrate kinase [Candidatus Omnitrophota bacterium]
MSILVLGTVALDTVKTPFGVRKNILGGSAVHFAMSARFFSRVNLVAIVGEDFPEKHTEFFKKKQIVLTSLIRSRGSTFHWEGEYQGDLNTALTHKTELGVLSAFAPQVHHSQRKIEYIFLANVDPDIQKKLLENMHAPKFVGLDSMNYWIKHKRASLLRLLKEVDIYVANDAEAREISGESNLLKAARYIRKIGPDMVLIKKGEHGVLFYCDKFLFSLPAYPTDKVIDPTGAGDTFAGAFMGYLSKVKSINERSLKRAIMYGTILASFNVEGFGTERTASLSPNEIAKRLKHFERIIRPN